MNPTEKFINTLMSALTTHEEETGTYIEKIHFKRVHKQEMQNVRALPILVEVKLELS